MDSKDGRSNSYTRKGASEEAINRFRVVIRTRPLLQIEEQDRKGKISCIKSNQSMLILAKPDSEQRDFVYDYVLDPLESQDQAYDSIARPVVQDILNGFNGVLMAYGQTGSGKTHTIFGSKPAGELNYQSGIVPRAVHHIFDYVKQNPNKAQFRVTISFLEIYMEQIEDLLLQSGASQTSLKSLSPIRNSATSLLQIREDPKTGIFVDGLTQVHVKNKEQLLQYVAQGMKRRAVNQTGMNKTSSRSHAVLQIFVEQKWAEPNHKQVYRKALLTIVDLAGSERLSKTGSDGLRLQEAKNINKSIAALSNCVSALASNKPLNFVPFRDSKLTRLLTESLGGNCRTTICACVSPSLIHFDESYSTLLFAARAMSVRTRASKNEKIDFKYVDENGRSVTRMGAESQNELFLKNQNSQLINKTNELKQEVAMLKAQLQGKFKSTQRGGQDLGSEQLSYISDNMSAYDAQGQSQINTSNGNWPTQNPPMTASPVGSYFGNISTPQVMRSQELMPTKSQALDLLQVIEALQTQLQLKDMIIAELLNK